MVVSLLLLFSGTVESIGGLSLSVVEDNAREHVTFYALIYKKCADHKETMS